MPINAADFSMICDLVRRRAGIVLEPGKEYLVETRLAQLARHHGLGGNADVIAGLRAAGAAGERTRTDVVHAMTTNETSFYRDQRPFDVLRDAVLPALIAARKDERALNIWCAASSTGQEPYTIAMTLAEHFPTVLATWRVSFVATDLSADVLARARLGKFNASEVGRGLPPALLAKYFARTGPAEWQACQRLRDLVEFRQLNLVEPWPAMAPLDLLFIRNVLIYFDADTKRDILRRARGLLRKDGYLFLGGAETTLNLDDQYEKLNADRSGCYRLRGAGGDAAKHAA